MSGELQRRIGLKVLDISGNCVLGYMQNFDLEGEHGIVVRGIGTVAFISKNNTNLTPNSTSNNNHNNSSSNAVPMSALVYSNNSNRFNFNSNHASNNTPTLHVSSFNNHSIKE